jgi:hypothetical protein
MKFEYETYEDHLIIKIPTKFHKDKPVHMAEGFFYVAQPIPEYNQNRLKLGFSTNIQERIRSHQTISPTFKIIKLYLSKKDWEYLAINGLLNSNCDFVNFLNNEVIECDDYLKILTHLDKFFETMPELLPIVPERVKKKTRNVIREEKNADMLDVVRTALQSSDSIQEAEKIFIEMTGNSRSTFYRYKQKMENLKLLNPGLGIN